MAKKISKEQMKGVVKDDEARALAEACSYGMGSPIESHTAAAFVEFSDNLKRLIKRLATFLETVKGLVGEVKASRAETRRLFEEQKRAAKEIAAAAEAIEAASRDMRGAKREIIEAELERFDKRILPLCEKKMKHASDNLARRSDTITSSLRELAERTERFNTAFEAKTEGAIGRLERLSRDQSMPASYKLVFIAVCILLVASTVTCCNATSTFAPIMTGEVAIAYSEGYENSLAEANHELAVARAELEAYKAAFPEGLTEGRQAALEERISELEAERAEQPAVQGE